MKKEVMGKARLNALVAFAVVMSASLSLHADDMVVSANGRPWIFAENNDGSLMITGVKLNAQCPVTIPSSLGGRPVTRIKEDAFRDNTMITGVTIPGCIVGIGDRAFAGCANLKELTLLEGVKAIDGSDAFRWCPALKTVTLPKSLTWIRQRVFRNGGNIERVNVDSVESYLSIGFGTGSSTPLSSGKACLCVNGVRISDLILPNGTRRINACAFNGANGLKSITIPGSVVQIGGYAFDNCSSDVAIRFASDIGALTLERNVAGGAGRPTVEVLPKNGQSFVGWFDSNGNEVKDPFHSTTQITVTPRWKIAGRGNDFQSRDSARTSLNEYDSHNRGCVYKTGDTLNITLPGGANMVMIYCAPGSSNGGGAIVRMDHGFWLGKYEVTQKQWESVMNGTNVENPSKWKGDNLPVEAVSWNDCQIFINRVNEKLKCGAHLPEESEWEYACRAGMDPAHQNSSLDVMAWHGRNSGHMTHVVGQKQANRWGFHDMLGNVWEWCNTRGIMRGGGWFRSPNSCHSGTRRYNNPNEANNDHGFRLCISTLPQSQIADFSRLGKNDGAKPQKRCWKCHGKGTVLKTVRETCDNCNGAKVITTKVTLNDRDWWYGNERKESLSTRGCPKCNRTGSVSVKREVECSSCHGTGAQ